eukprot:724615-Pyramimonas_sp.AAC.1
MECAAFYLSSRSRASASYAVRPPRREWAHNAMSQRHGNHARARLTRPGPRASSLPRRASPARSARSPMKSTPSSGATSVVMYLRTSWALAR